MLLMYWTQKNVEFLKNNDIINENIFICYLTQLKIVRD